MYASDRRQMNNAARSETKQSFSKEYMVLSFVVTALMIAQVDLCGLPPKYRHNH